MLLGLLYHDNCMILTSTIFDLSTFETARQTRDTLLICCCVLMIIRQFAGCHKAMKVATMMTTNLE